MTLAICIRVGEGAVLAADSATALKAGQGIGHIYHSARKLIRPHRELPVGMVTFGQGTLADQSIAQLAIQLRQRLEAGGNWEVDPQNYTVAELAMLVRDFYRERVDAIPEELAAQMHAPLGFLIAGYSAQAELAETYEVKLSLQQVFGPIAVDPDQNWSLACRGFSDPIDRLVDGATALGKAVLGGTAQGQLALEAAHRQYIRAEMPLGEAVEAARWLVEVVIGALHYGPAAELVGGEVDIARINLEDGFQWVQQQQLPFDAQANDQLP